MVKKFNDLSGHRYGNLVVECRTDDYVSPGGHKSVQYRCKCDCGNYRNVVASHLTSGKAKFCIKCVNDRKRRDLIGKIFGHLFVEKQIENHVSSGGNSFVQYQCRCDCGRIKKVTALKLTSGHTRSCGQCNVFNRRKDLTGQRFDKLTVISAYGEYTYPDGSHDIRWLCQCDCGREVVIRGNSLKDTNFRHTCEYCYRHKRSDWKNMIGLRSGKLTVISRAEDRFSSVGTVVDRWECACDCGKHIIVDGTRIRHNYTKSCGCLRLETLQFTTRSSYEILVQNYLDEHHYKYEMQKTFSGLVGVHGGLLPYDFYINDDLKCLIECQGEQHYKPVEFFGGEETFKITQRHDKRKSDYAMEYNIPLLQLNCRTHRSEHDIIFDLELFLKNHII